MSCDVAGFRIWDDWLNSSLAHLQNAQLLRTLRPTVWCNSSSEALIHRADLDAWVTGLAPVARHYDHCASICGSAAAVVFPSSETDVRVASAPHRTSSHYPESHPDVVRGAPRGDELTSPPLSSSLPRITNPTTTISDSSSCSSSPHQQVRQEAYRDGGDRNIGRCGNPNSQAPSKFNSSSSIYSGSGSMGDPRQLVRLRLFSLNDYLGLASHPEVAEAAARASKLVGMGPRSSALVAGYTHSHRQLEEQLADLKGTEDCLLFPTGFAANLAVMTSLSYASPTPAAGVGGGSGLAIFSDELNHASIIDGARLASRGAGGGGGAVHLHVYRHNDINHLESLLAASPPGVRKLVVTDSLFSMDGDFADLQGLVALRRRHSFLLAVDEAHAALVCGEGGGGAAEAMGVSNEVDLHVGTLSKAFGSLGGFVGCSSAMKQLLLNRGRTFVYSTSLPVPVVEAAAAALRVSRRETWRRAHVWSLVRRLGHGLGVPALSPVVPLVVGPEGPTLQLSSFLLSRGLHVPAIRPPTVPPGTCRLRVSLSAAHSYDDVDELIRLVRRSDVQLVRLPHLLDPRAALPQPSSLWSSCGFGADGGGDSTLLPYSRL